MDLNSIFGKFILLPANGLWSTVEESLLRMSNIFLEGLLVKDSRPHPLYAAIMKLLWRRLRKCFCGHQQKEGNEDDPTSQRSEDEGSSLPLSNPAPEKEMLIQKSLKRRIEEYQKAANSKQRGKFASLASFDRGHSTRDVISRFETMRKEPRSSRSVSISNDDVFPKKPRSPTNAMMISCAVCLNTIYPTDPFTTTNGWMVHISCFSCQQCHIKLKNHPMEAHVELPSGHLFCICSKCQYESLHKDNPKVMANVAGMRIHVNQDELGDVQGVKDAIGDELEDILLEKVVPRCQVCSGDFLNYTGRICTVGQTKYHQECWETGKPSANLAERLLVPYQAAKYLPERWIIRMVGKGEDGKSQSLATLFFVWKTRQQDFQKILSSGALTSKSSVQISLELDDQAVGNPNYNECSKRKTKADIPCSWECLDLELIGNPMAGASLTSKTEFEEGIVQIQKTSDRFLVKHVLLFSVPTAGSTSMDLTGARMAIYLHQ